MTYQRNICRPLSLEENLLDERLEHEVRQPEVRANDNARDEDDDRRLDDLLLRRPLDLLELAPGLRDELRAGEATLRLGLRLLVGARGRAGRRRWRPSRKCSFARSHGAALSPAGASLCSRLTSHQRVSRWGVWHPHQRQYFLNSTRSGVFRFDLFVW